MTPACWELNAYTAWALCGMLTTTEVNGNPRKNDALERVIRRSYLLHWAEGVSLRNVRKHRHHQSTFENSRWKDRFWDLNWSLL